jgi:DNA-binding CsgD family transcriptional regulator
MLALLDELRAVALQPAVLQQRLLEGLCRLTGAASGAALVVGLDSKGRHPRFILTASTPTAVAPAARVDPELMKRCLDAAWRRLHRSRPFAGAGADALDAGCVRGRKLDHCLLSKPHPSGVVVSGLFLRRGIDQKRSFSAGDLLLVDLVHFAAQRLVMPESAYGGHYIANLTSRQYQTLQALLGGRSEKEIADQFGLSTNTIHHYVKAIHRNFNVSSRGELLAYFIKRAIGA